MADPPACYLLMISEALEFLSGDIVLQFGFQVCSQTGTKSQGKTILQVSSATTPHPQPTENGYDWRLDTRIGHKLHESLDEDGGHAPAKAPQKHWQLQAAD